MKYTSIFILCIFLLLVSCWKEPNTSHFFNIHGSLYDSITGNRIAGQSIYFNSSLGTTDNTELTVNYGINGEFTAKIPTNYFGNGHDSPLTQPDDVFYLLAYNDSTAGYGSFKFGDLIYDGTLQKDFYLIPTGNIELYLVDTSYISFLNIKCTSIIGNNLISYKAQNNAYADTTILFRAFANTTSKMHLWNSTDRYDSIFVISNDTAFKTIYY